MSEYAKEYYKVQSDIGRRVTVDGKPGIIYKDGGQYISVNFDSDKPGFSSPCHPTWKVEYLEMGKPRKTTASQKRYQKYLEVCECYDNFKHYLVSI